MHFCRKRKRAHVHRRKNANDCGVLWDLLATKSNHLTFRIYPPICNWCHYLLSGKYEVAWSFQAFYRTQVHSLPCLVSHSLTPLVETWMIWPWCMKIKILQPYLALLYRIFPNQTSSWSFVQFLLKLLLWTKGVEWVKILNALVHCAFGNVFFCEWLVKNGIKKW